MRPTHIALMKTGCLLAAHSQISPALFILISFIGNMLATTAIVLALARLERLLPAAPA